MLHVEQPLHIIQMLQDVLAELLSRGHDLAHVVEVTTLVQTKDTALGLGL